jgi:hypothetical protein
MFIYNEKLKCYVFRLINLSGVPLISAGFLKEKS